MDALVPDLWTTGIPPARPHVLIVDSSPDTCEMLQLALEETGYRTTSVSNVPDAAAFLDRKHTDVALVDVPLRRDPEGAVVRHARSRRAVVVLMSRHPVVIERAGGGEPPFIPKPFRLSDLHRRIASALASYASPRRMSLKHKMASALLIEIEHVPQITTDNPGP